MIKFNKRYYGVEFDIELKDKVCLFRGNCGFYSIIYDGDTLRTKKR